MGDHPYAFYRERGLGWERLWKLYSYQIVVEYKRAFGRTRLATIPLEGISPKYSLIHERRCLGCRGVDVFVFQNAAAEPVIRLSQGRANRLQLGWFIHSLVAALTMANGIYDSPIKTG